MKFPKLTDDLSIISKLGDNPGADDGLTSAGLKAKFDEAALILQAYLNGTLIETLNEIFESGSMLPSEGLNMSGTINMNRNPLVNLKDPTNDGDAVSLSYANSTYVPQKRTVNGKKLSSNITLTASDVGARGNTWLPTISEIGAAPASHATDKNNPHGVSISQIGAAPSGYGLGETAYKLAELADADAAKNIGWYRITSATKNGIGVAGLMRVESASSTYLVQTAIRSSDGAEFKRHCRNTDWSDWKQSYPNIGMTILWENASPTSSFAEQTVSLGLSDYTDIIVVAKNNGGNHMSMARVGESVSFVDGSAYRFVNITSGGVQVMPGYDGTSVSNDKWIPLRIYGIKGVN